MNRSEKSIYTAISSIAYAFIYGLLNLIVIKLIISQYGSDFNGINSSASQFIGMLLLLEGGFTLAFNVSLFNPIVTNNILKINKIISVANKIFKKIGLAVLIIGVLGSLAYSRLIKSDLTWEISAITFIMVVIPTAFNLGYASKYSILLQSDQREYILNVIKTATVVFSQGIVLVVIVLKGHMLLVRVALMVGALISSVLIAIVCKRRYRFLNFNESPDYSLISGTRDVLAQKITGVIYGTVPILFISATVGTVYASVYAVYNGVFMLIKTVIMAFSAAPRMGFGQLITEQRDSYLKEVFTQYEFIVIVTLLCLLSVTVVLVMPFIALYTAGVTDINYLSWPIAAMFIGISFFEVIHLPSGTIINMAGRFKVSRNIQVIAAITLVVSMVIGNQIFGFYGILGGVLITALLLAILEITYIQKIYFKGGGYNFIKFLIPNLLLTSVLVIIEMICIPEIDAYVKFAIVGLTLILINGISLLAFNYIVNKEFMLGLKKRLDPFINSIQYAILRKNNKQSNNNITSV